LALLADIIVCIFQNNAEIVPNFARKIASQK